MEPTPSTKDSQNINQSYEKQISSLQYAERLNYTLFDISNAVNTTYNLEGLYQSIYDSLDKLMPLPNFYIAMYDRKNKCINFDYFVDEYDDDFPIINTIKEPNCLTGEVIIAKRPLFLKENALLERAKKNKIVGSVPKIWIGIPLIIRDKVIGAICVQNYTDPDYFSHKHLEILVCVSDQIAIAIERKQILDVLKKKEQTIQNRKRDSRGPLAGGIAHDFNNLLSGIMGHLELLNINQETLDALQKDHITSALIASKRAAKLIRQLQTLTKSNTFDPAIIDISKVITDVFNILEQTTNPLIEKRNELVENKLFVEGYEEELHQIFMNLGMNAIRAIEEKGTLSSSFIKVYAQGKSEDFSKNSSHVNTDFLHICFQDTGCGMADEVKGKAFDPMFSTKKTGDKKGQGLGLAMVYYIVTKKHSGHIDIETTPGIGSTFNIYLPVSNKAISADKKVNHTKDKTRTVLVIEDENTVREMVVKALKSFGYNALQAPDGEIGLGIYKKNHRSIDAVILDVIMPRMSGTQAFKRMLEIDSEIKVIIASGHVTNQDQKKIFAKASAYLDKPYQIMELKQVLQSILD